MHVMTGKGTAEVAGGGQESTLAAEGAVSDKAAGLERTSAASSAGQAASTASANGGMLRGWDRRRLKFWPRRAEQTAGGPKPLVQSLVMSWI